MSTTHTAQSNNLKSLKTRARRGVRKSRRDEPKVESAQVPLPRKAAPTPVAGRDVRSERKPTKQQICLDLLRRPKGASIEELQAATGWQAHSVRGFLSGTVGKKLGLAVTSAKVEDGERTYYIKA